MVHYKDLYLASSIDGLTKMAQNNSDQVVQENETEALLNAAEKLYKSQTVPYDQEMTYIIVSRFLIIYEHLLSLPNHTNDIEMLLGKKAQISKNQINNLNNHLIKRYDEAKQLKDKTSNKPILRFNVQRYLIFNNELFVSCTDLFFALTNKEINMLVLDVRSPKDFSESHIITKNIINIPEDNIQAGISAHELGTTLNESSKLLWDKRDTYDAIALLDWDTSKSCYVASKIDKLRRAILEWDIGRPYKEKPVVLNYGYTDWLELYPILCTSDTVLYAKSNRDLDDLLNLEDIGYPIENGIYTEETKQPDVDLTGKVVDVGNEKGDQGTLDEDRQLLLDEAQQAKKPKMPTELVTQPVINRDAIKSQSLINTVKSGPAMSPKKWSKNTLGWARAEVLGALADVVFIVAFCFSVTVEACKRFIEVESFHGPVLLIIVGSIGLLINLIGLFLFHEHGSSHGHSQGRLSRSRNRLTHMAVTDDNENDATSRSPPPSVSPKASHGHSHSGGSAQMNMRGVFLHVLSDALGSVIVIISALIFWLTDWKYKYYIDPALSILLVLLILHSVWPLLRDSALILLQTVPTHIQVDAMQRRLLTKVDGVLAVHEFHVWKLAGDGMIASAHIRCRSLSEYMRIAEKVKEFFHNEGIHLTTIQPEFVDYHEFPESTEEGEQTEDDFQ